MYTQNLNSDHCKWSLYVDGEGEGLPARVPGSVYQALLDNGKMEDPYYRDNELKALALMDRDYTYRTEFELSDGLRDCEQILLRFEGIDTVADIFLNGRLLASVCNMHRTFEYPVKELLQKGRNELKVVLHSPTRYIQEAYENRFIDGSSDAMRGFSYLRKAHCMFGWDWGPRLPDAGIWRNVSLVGYNTARLDGVYITQEHNDGKVRLKFRVDVDKPGEERILSFGRDDGKLTGLSYAVKVTGPEGEIYELRHTSADVTLPELLIPAPRLWWPNGYGEQPLYQAEVILEREGEILDSWKKRIGLRTLTVHIEKDAYGETFAHEVNGVQIFAMGADYIPEDNILPRVTPGRTRELLMQAKNAHFNCIRVWGGGYYPGDDFWDACDELGLIVWEDFMFACAVYHLTEEFEENITAEFIDNIKRIRHHASLALWCGNNEMESFVESGLWVSRQQERADYIKMYEYIIPKVLKEHDPNTFYWPSSPSSGGSFDCPNDPDRGDTHYWDVWHGNKPITEFRKFFFRYVSEFGFQSFPLMKTVETFAEPEDRNIFSYVMEKHQRNRSANGKIMHYMEQTYLYPGSFDLTLYASQLLQAEALRYGVEHFRRNRGRCMGTIIWQLNDCWPVASWATIDYCGRWKAAQYYAKRFFAPVLISCEEEGILTQDTNPNAQPYEVKKSIRLNIANETREERRLRVEWNLRNSMGEIIRGGDALVTVPGLSAVWLEKQDCGDADLYEHYVSYECWEADGKSVFGASGREKDSSKGAAESAEELPLSFGTVMFCPPKHFHFADPGLTVEADGDELIVTAKAYAKSVEIQNENQDILLSDNYFDMNGGTRRLKILKGRPVGLKIRSVYDIR
ncbi:MAG: glycoside hydrolase family 2 protein [Butyrivibrio sp.]|nr:glycoside hydrolase family 2 protein [Acetatifactor muris]MCM1559830.1 glycoside hydrolase family 2 protein [Butyrivibrio sp.]